MYIYIYIYIYACIYIYRQFVGRPATHGLSLKKKKSKTKKLSIPAAGQPDIYIYIYIHIYVYIYRVDLNFLFKLLAAGLQLGLYKTLFHFEAVMWESIVLLLPPPTCTARTNAILLHVYCARYDAPPTPPLYAIHYTILVMAISCKGQVITQRFFSL